MRKPRLILCEDNSLLRQILERFVSKRGYEVIGSDTPIMCAFYRDGNRCPQHIRCADILITDYMMPRMSGLDLLEMQHRGGCKLDSRNKALITAFADSYVEEKVKELGCKFFFKPVDLSLLKEWLDACETRFDLSQPLVSELVEPVEKE